MPKPRRLPPTPHGRCCLCNRALKPGAPMIQGFGLVGPECKKKIEVLAALRDLVQEVPLGTLTPEAARALNHAVIDLRMLGFRVDVLDTTEGKVACVRGPAEGMTAKRAYERLWAAREKLRALARLFAPDKIRGEGAAASDAAPSAA